MGFFATCLFFFAIFATTSPASGCGYTVKAIDREQTISSPGFPYSYENYAHCTWKIQAEYGSHVTLNVTDVDLGVGDYVSIYDGIDRNNLLASYSDPSTLAGQSVFTTKSNAAIVYFTSNYINGGNTGFSMRFVMDCLDNDKCSQLGLAKACADADIGQTFCPKLCGSCPNLLSQLLG